MRDYTKEMSEAAAAAGISPPRIVQPTDHYAQINGIRMHYLDWGNPQLPPLLLLHGGRLTAHTWDMAALLLRDHYHIVALSQRGHGDTEWTPEAKMGEDRWDQMLEDTRQFVAHLGYPKIFLVGMSMGGINTIRYSARHSDTLKAVGIVDVAPTLMPQGVQQIGDFGRDTDILERFEDFLERSVQYMPHRPVAHLRYSLMHSLKQRPDGRWTWKQDNRPRALGTRAPDSSGFEDLWKDVPRITVPALVFWGMQSKVLAKDVAEKMVRMLPKGEFVAIDKATHNVHSDNPGEFARALHAFLSRYV